MRLSTRYLLVVLALVALVGLGLLFPGVTNTWLVAPIGRIAWLAYRTLRTVDESVYWTLLVAVGVIAALRILPGRQEYPPRPTYASSSKVEDRVAYWDALLENAEEDGEARQALARELETLNHAVDTLAEGNGEVKLELPQAKKDPLRPVRAAWNHSPLARLAPPRKMNRSPLEHRVEQILSTMETKLERNNDRSTNATDQR